MLLTQLTPVFGDRRRSPLSIQTGLCRSDSHAACEEAIRAATKRVQAGPVLDQRHTSAKQDRTSITSSPAAKPVLAATHRG